MSVKTSDFEVAVVGGGLYGAMIALVMAKKYRKVILIEKFDGLLTRASYNNQARVHNGYHYPRSFLTALRSHANYSIFLNDFSDAIADKTGMYYAIAKTFSKTTARQFARVCEQFGSPLRPVEERVRSLFNDVLIDDIFKVDEAIFDAGILRKILKERLRKLGVKVMYKTQVVEVARDPQGVVLKMKDGRDFRVGEAYICTYSQINRILIASGLSALPFKYEMTEMPLFRAPVELEGIGITVLDGPFWGALPFPDRGLHTLYHVRYTVHATWFDDGRGIWPDLAKLSSKTNFLYMIKDAARYLPILSGVRRESSLYEVRTVLQKDEINDGRPILYKRNYDIPGLNVMGGKIDNIYDILEKIEKDESSV